MSDGVLLYDGSRGLTWARLRHAATGRDLLVYGTNPIAGGEETWTMHLRNGKMATSHMAEQQAEGGDAPVLYLGDFNEASPSNPAPTLLTAGTASWQGASYSTAGLKFELVHHNWVDYIYTEAGRFARVSSETIVGAPGGSDHQPILAVVTML